jgi:hypothetical protein
MRREGGMAAWFFCSVVPSDMASVPRTLGARHLPGIGIATLVITQGGTELEQRASSALASTRALGSLFRWIGVLEMTVTYTGK